LISKAILSFMGALRDWQDWKLWRGLEYVGGLSTLAKDAARSMATQRWEGAQILYQMDVLGVQSFSIVLITATFMGMVLAIQTAYALDAFGAKLYVGEVVSISMTRELAPVIISLMVGGRVGAGITAEIGAMKVTEQIDALRAMGANPVRKLVVPRLIAVVFFLPLLVLLADALGILGGYIISTLELQISGRFYFSHAFRMLKFADVLSGLGKTGFFACAITLIGCYNGMTAGGGADGVGRATTFTVVLSSIVILISNFFLTKLFLAI
jgi:phospholipid/cholesterol/gamma-HCH transport system permease protein